MTKKDYIAFAGTLRATRPTHFNEGSLGYYQWEMDVEAIADVLTEDNPSFDRDRFLTAAGHTS